MKFCWNCGKQLEDECIFCSGCGTCLQNDVFASEVNKTDETCNIISAKNKKRNKILFAVIIPIIAVILIVTISFTAVVFPYLGPVTQIVHAVVRTANAESLAFTVELSDDIGDYKRQCIYDAAIVVDYDKKDIQIYCEIEGTYSYPHYENYYDDGFTRVTENISYVMGIYDGILFTYDKNSKDIYNEDISEVIEDCFDVYKDKNDYIGLNGVNFDALFEKLYDISEGEIDLEDADDYVDYDELNKALQEAWKTANSKKWLEENMNYEKERKSGVTYYSFEPDYRGLAKSVEEIFSDCICDNELEKEFDEVLDYMKKDMNKDENCEVKVTVGVDKSYIKQVNIETSDGDIDITFDKINSVSINREALATYIE